MANAIIVVPCYNEENRLNRASFSEFSSPSHNINFLFVNDGSTDRTLSLLQSLVRSNPNKFAVINFSQNCGKAEAVRQGFLSAVDSRPDYIGFWDADLATPLEAITEFLDMGKSRPDLEMIMGSRVRLLGRRVERSPFRHYLGRCFATVVSMILGLGVYDTQCGAKLFRASPATKRLFEKPFGSRWIFDVEILARLIQAERAAKKAGEVIYELPLKEWRDIQGSKLKYSDFFRAPLELLRIRKAYFSKS